MGVQVGRSFYQYFKVGVQVGRSFYQYFKVGVQVGLVGLVGPGRSTGRSQIPASALLRYGDEWAVFELNNGRAYKRIIKIGKRNGLVVEVLDGLTLEQNIILYPGDTIIDGRRVKVRSYD